MEDESRRHGVDKGGLLQRSKYIHNSAPPPAGGLKGAYLPRVPRTTVQLYPWPGAFPNLVLSGCRCRASRIPGMAKG
jgi:hypothetical protein